MLKFSDKQETIGSILIDVSCLNKEKSKTIISAGAIPLMAGKLRSRVNWMVPPAIRINLVWCFMNLAIDSDEFRQVLFANGIDKILVRDLMFSSSHID
jgi:hypothetical protein